MSLVTSCKRKKALWLGHSQQRICVGDGVGGLFRVSYVELLDHMGRILCFILIAVENHEIVLGRGAT